MNNMNKVIKTSNTNSSDNICIITVLMISLNGTIIFDREKWVSMKQTQHSDSKPHNWSKTCELVK